MTQARYDVDLKIPADVAVKGDDSACGMSAPTGWPGFGRLIQGVRKVDFETEGTLFSQESHDHLCQHCSWAGRGPCEKPPPVPPPPPSQQDCEQKGCSYDTAQKLCSSLESHEAAYEDCLVDICATCGDDDTDPIAIAQNAVENEEQMAPGPCCLDASSECGLPTDTCTNSVKMNLFNQVSNNLGGVGPDAGVEEIKFSQAAAVKGQILDLIIKGSGAYKSKNPSANGKSNSGAFGVINLKAKSSVDLEFSWVDSTTGAAVSLDQVAISFYDIDEGKKGKSRTTLTACGADNAIVTTNTELTLNTVANCYAVSSSTL